MLDVDSTFMSGSATFNRGQYIIIVVIVIVIIMLERYVCHVITMVVIRPHKSAR